MLKNYRYNNYQLNTQLRNQQFKKLKEFFPIKISSKILEIDFLIQRHTKFNEMKIIFDLLSLKYKYIFCAILYKDKYSKVPKG